MISRVLPFLNYLILGFAGFLLVGSFIFWMLSPGDIDTSDGRMLGVVHEQKNAFEMPKEAYQAIDKTIFPITFQPPVLQLPDLRQQLIYHGKNGRPDAQQANTLLYFGFKGGQALSSTAPGGRLYLQHLPRPSAQPYTFSQNNEETSLWIEPILQDNEVVIKVFMKNDQGELVREPQAHAEFRLPEKEYMHAGGTNWQIGPFRVDGTLLARQHAKWYGKDIFLETHGGDEYKEMAGKQRIDLGENEGRYSVFMQLGDFLIWDGDRWRAVKPEESSLSYPILTVKRVDDRLMTFELWDVDGKAKMVLNLLKSNEAWAGHGPDSLQKVLKFVGARKKSQFIFEINGKRLLVSPGDWLLNTENGWKKLATEQEIDDYVTRKVSGILFVFEGITRRDGQQILAGKLYNGTRTEMQPINLAVQQGGSLIEPSQEEEEEEVARDKEKEKSSAIPANK